MNSYDPNDNIIEKINTFKALVENFDDDIALKYLEKSGWDETVFYFIFTFKFLFPKQKAAQLYYDDQSESLARNLHSNENRQNTQNNPRINASNNYNNDLFGHNNEIGISEHLLQNEGKNKNRKIEKFLLKFILFLLKLLFVSISLKAKFGNN